MSRGSNQEWPPFDASAFGEPDATSSRERGAGGTAGSPSGDSPSGDSPSGDSPSGDSPSGDSPSHQTGDNSARPSGHPSGEQKGDHRTTDDRQGTLAERVARLERRLERRNDRIRRLERRLARTEDREDTNRRSSAGWSDPDDRSANRGRSRRRSDRAGGARADAVSAPGGDVAAESGTGTRPGGDRDAGVAGISTTTGGSALRPSLDGVVARLRERIEALDEVAVAMLRHYRDHGPVRPPDAHASVGGSGDRVEAYAVNRRLRERGLVAHVGRGHHDYALASLADELAADPLDPDARLSNGERDRVVDAVEATFVEGVQPPSADREVDSDVDGVGRRGDSEASDSSVSATGRHGGGQRSHPQERDVGRRSTTWRAVPWPEH